MSAALHTAAADRPEPTWAIRERQAVVLTTADISSILGSTPEATAVDQVSYNPTNLHPSNAYLPNTASGHLFVTFKRCDGRPTLPLDQVQRAITAVGMAAFAHHAQPARRADWTKTRLGDLENCHPDRPLLGLELVICVCFQDGDQATAQFDATVFAQCPVDMPAAQKQGPYVAFRSTGNVVALTTS